MLSACALGHEPLLSSSSAASKLGALPDLQEDPQRASRETYGEMARFKKKPQTPSPCPAPQRLRKRHMLLRDQPLFVQPGVKLSMASEVAAKCVYLDE